MKINLNLHNSAAQNKELKAQQLFNKSKLKTNSKIDLNQIPNANYNIAFMGIKKSPEPSTAEKLSKLKEEMSKNGIDALIVPSTDNYLNEYVPDKFSQRVYMSRFTGSVGDLIIMPEKSKLIVDGRYFIQADQQVDHSVFDVEKLGLDKNGNRLLNNKKQPLNENSITRQIKVLSDWANKTPYKTLKLGVDASKISQTHFSLLEKHLKTIAPNLKLVPTKGNLVDKIWANKPKQQIAQIREVPVQLIGETSAQRLEKVRGILKQNNLDMIAINDLSDIAYITNLRGRDVQSSAVFKSRMLVTLDRAILFCNPRKFPTELLNAISGNFEVKSEKDYKHIAKELANGITEPKIAVSKNVTTKACFDALKSATKVDEFTELNSEPIAEMRAIKNNTEMESYRKAIQKTDKAIIQTMTELNTRLRDGETVTEKDLEDIMLKYHKANGALDLSFDTIPAAGKNSAIIHYEKGNPNVKINIGDLVLVDTGAYYDSGLATDLTRTWIAGGKFAAPTAKQKEVYTTVLKGALRGLFAELPPNAGGKHLDDIVRGTITNVNPEYDYNHSTGHGVGTVVHEMPPYIGRRDSGEYLKEGMIFSIEPGTYIEDWGGVRFENLATIVKHPDPKKAAEGWHKVKCLSFAPIDYNLVDKAMLTKYERKLLKKFTRKTRKLLEDIRRAR